MGLKPDELYRTTLYDFNRMTAAFMKNRRNEWDQVRTHAWLVSVYSGLDRNARRKLRPSKMLPLEGEKPPKPTRKELDKRWAFFKRKTIKKKVLN